MATLNPFDLLGDDDAEDPSQLIAAQRQLVKPAQPVSKPPAKLPSKPLPPSQAVREAKNEAPRGMGRGGNRGVRRGRGGGRGFNRDSADNEASYGRNNEYSGLYRASEDGDAEKPLERRGYGSPRGGFRGGRRGGFVNGESAEGERPRRFSERRSGTGRGHELKRDGAGRGNWGLATDENAPENEEKTSNEGEKVVDTEKQQEQVESGDAKEETFANEAEEKEPEEKEMTLEEYEKVLEEKRKALLAFKTTEERKVDLDKEFQSMQLLSNKKNDDDVFVKLGSDKDKRKEATEKAKKAVSINEFLKPADGENFYRPGGRGRERGRGRGGYAGNNINNVGTPSIQDAAQFPVLAK